MGWITVGKMVTHIGGEPHSFWFQFESATFKGPITACAGQTLHIVEFEMPALKDRVDVHEFHRKLTEHLRK